eukprot:3337077-Prymnesium_polylepis.1
MSPEAGNHHIQQSEPLGPRYCTKRSRVAYFWSLRLREDHLLVLSATCILCQRHRTMAHMREALDASPLT